MKRLDNRAALVQAAVRQQPVVYRRRGWVESTFGGSSILVYIMRVGATMARVEEVSTGFDLGWVDHRWLHPDPPPTSE